MGKKAILSLYSRFTFFRMYVCTVWWFGLSFILFPLNRWKPITSIIFRKWARGICHIGKIHVKVKGLDQIQANKTYLFISNHVNFFDVPVLLSTIQNDLKMFAKKSLLDFSFVGEALSLGGYLSIDYDNHVANLKSIRSGINYLKDKKSIIIFPEGSRYQTGKIEKFEKGFLTLLYQSQVDLVPIILIGTDKINNDEEYILAPPQHVYTEMHVLPPINRSNFESREHCLAYVHKTMQNYYLEHKTK